MRIRRAFTGFVSVAAISVCVGAFPVASWAQAGAGVGASAAGTGVGVGVNVGGSGSSSTAHGHAKGGNAAASGDVRGSSDSSRASANARAGNTDQTPSEGRAHSSDASINAGVNASSVGAHGGISETH